MESTTEKKPAGLVERPILPKSASPVMTHQSICVIDPAPLYRERGVKIPMPVQKRSPEMPDLEPLQRTINSVDYYHCAYELLYRFIESSIALVPTFPHSLGAKQS
jgi:hypothetical protein